MSTDWKEAPEGDTAAGAKTFKTKCGQCHTPEKGVNKQVFKFIEYKIMCLYFSHVCFYYIILIVDEVFFYMYYPSKLL